MALKLSAATAADVDRIASVHLAAFDSNVLLHAQFPTRASLSSLESILSQEMLDSIKKQDDGKAVLVVRDTDADNQIISFAKWDLPGLSKGVHHPGVTWPKDCRQEFLNEYHEKAEAAKTRVIGDRPCYRLTFVGTHPNFRGRGAGTLLSEWGLSQAKADNVPVYLESTTAASSLYRRLGFVALDGLSMTLPGQGPDGGPNIYEEVSMLRTWDEDNDMEQWDSSLNVQSLVDDYEAGIKPQHVIQAIYDRIEAYKEVQPSLWIHLQRIGRVMRAANELHTRWPDVDMRPPLWGIPFSVKDNIDVAGIPTTNSLPALAFTPNESASTYQKCIDAGALFIGKTNMEQLATGMTGCRSPYGTLHSTFSKVHAVGGSSSGSAVSVSANLVSFSLGSDTAGSIRLPAVFNGIVGFKPTKGTVSARGVFPACQHQDTIGFHVSSVADAKTVWEVCAGFDKDDFFSKRPSAPREPIMHGEPPKSARKSGCYLAPLIATPPPSALEACSPPYLKRFNQVIDALESFHYGTYVTGRRVNLGWTPFATASSLLYEKSFVLERLTILPEGWFETNKQLMHPVTRQVFESALARKTSAIDVFRDLHTQAECKRIVENMMTYEHNQDTNAYKLTVMIVPTAPFHPTIEEVEEAPIEVGSKLGEFAHFANVLDLCAVAVPCGTYEVDEVDEVGQKIRLPFGVTILAGHELDEQLLDIAGIVENMLRDVGENDEQEKVMLKSFSDFDF